MSNCSSLYGRIRDEILNSTSSEKKILLAVFGSILSLILALVTAITALAITKWKSYNRSIRRNRSERRTTEPDEEVELRNTNHSRRRRRRSHH